MNFHRQVAAAVLLTVGVAGCAGTGDAPPRAPVMGLVTLDGELLNTGVIRFVPADGTTGPQTTAVIDRGLFTLPAEQGPIVGTHRVEIVSTDTGGLAMDDEQALATARGADPTLSDLWWLSASTALAATPEDPAAALAHLDRARSGSSSSGRRRSRDHRHSQGRGSGS